MSQQTQETDYPSATRAMKHLMDGSDRKILAFKANILNFRREFLDMSALNTEAVAIRIEEKLDTLRQGTIVLPPHYDLFC
jgi:hypothetical protein